MGWRIGVRGAISIGSSRSMAAIVAHGLIDEVEQPSSSAVVSIALSERENRCPLMSNLDELVWGARLGDISGDLGGL